MAKKANMNNKDAKKIVMVGKDAKKAKTNN